MTENFRKSEADALEFANRAIEFDQQYNYDAATYYYRVAAQTLHSAYLQGSQLAGIKEKADEYLKRAEDLQKIKASALERKPEKNEEKLELERAEFLLRQGLEEDEAGNEEEATELYLQAAELCIKAKNITQDKDLKAKLSLLATNALDRAETLKSKNKPAEATLPVLPSVTDLPQLSNLSVRPTQQQTLAHQAATSPAKHPTQVVSGSGKYTKHEIAVLKATSTINGREYVPFMSIDLRERFAFTLPFSDKDGKLLLNKRQIKSFSKWARLEDLSSHPVLIDKIDCFSIKQTVIQDCSFVASMTVSALYEKKFKKKILTSMIYPQNKAGEPVYNPCGKYMIKLNFNGVPRKVVIDDYLPLGIDGQLLCSFSMNKNEFWVSLLEKAYMKVMGGYDFPGSNSNVDLHTLTGWIPDRYNFKQDSANFDKNHVVNMIIEKHRTGDVLVTTATGPLSDEEAERAGLVRDHAYAVLDIREVMGLRMLLLKNPWSHLRWKGKFSDLDTKNWTPEMKQALKYDPKNAQAFDNGVFWIDFDSWQHFFDILYINWNPELFKYTYCLHQCWKASLGPARDSYNVGDNPQFCLDVKESGCPVWILLTRHIVDRDDFADNKEFIAIVVYKNDGNRVYYPTTPEPFINGVRVNSPHQLTKFIIPKNGTTRYTLVVSQYEKNTTIYFSLRVYCGSPFTLTPIASVCKYKEEVKNGEWTQSLSGGCGNYPTHHQNPIYQITLQSPHDDNHVLIDLKGPKQYAVGFDIVTVTVNNSSSPGYFKSLSSGQYRSGFSIKELQNVPSGTYNIIPSTFKPGQIGPFFLTVQASCPLKMARLK